MTDVTPLSPSDRIIRLLATGFGVGYAPLMPGTVGTLVGIPLYLGLAALSRPLQVLLLLAFTGLACWVSDRAEGILGQKDSPRIVIDEIVGFQWAMLLVTPAPVSLILGFAFFRLFDILKPFPADYCQRRLPGGWGVVADDVAAGLYARLALLGLAVFFNL